MNLKDKSVLLSTLWIFVLFNYLFCDVLGLMDAHLLKQYLTGMVEGIHMTQSFLLAAGLLMEIPIAMIILARLLKYNANRWVNIFAGSIMTLVQVATLLMGSFTQYYLFFSIIEITTTLFIVWISWTWKKSEGD